MVASFLIISVICALIIFMPENHDDDNDSDSDSDNYQNNLFI
jgi:hypothetical protein